MKSFLVTVIRRISHILRQRMLFIIMTFIVYHDLSQTESHHNLAIPASLTSVSYRLFSSQLQKSPYNSSGFISTSMLERSTGLGVATAQQSTNRISCMSPIASHVSLIHFCHCQNCQQRMACWKTLLSLGFSVCPLDKGKTCPNGIHFFASILGSCSTVQEVPFSQYPCCQPWYSFVSCPRFCSCGLHMRLQAERKPLLTSWSRELELYFIFFKKDAFLPIQQHHRIGHFVHYAFASCCSGCTKIDPLLVPCSHRVTAFREHRSSVASHIHWHLIFHVRTILTWNIYDWAAMTKVPPTSRIQINEIEEQEEKRKATPDSRSASRETFAIQTWETCAPNVFPVLAINQLPSLCVLFAFTKQNCHSPNLVRI